MSLLHLGGTVSFAAKLLPVYSRAPLRGPLSKCHPQCRTCTSHPPQKVAHSGTRCFLAERVLHQYAEAPRRPPQPHRRRRRQQVPGGCERPTAPHRVQLRGSQTHEASLALHSGDHRQARTCSESRTFSFLFVFSSRFKLASGLQDVGSITETVLISHAK